MNFVEVKAETRRTVHRQFAVPATITQNGGQPVPVTARLHTRVAQGGDLGGEGYATIWEGVTRTVFNREELATANSGVPLLLGRGDVVTFPNYRGAGEDVAFVLDTREPYDGPVDEKWNVNPYQGD